VLAPGECAPGLPIRDSSVVWRLAPPTSSLPISRHLPSSRQLSSFGR
jgi:hypothetical protein